MWSIGILLSKLSVAVLLLASCVPVDLEHTTFYIEPSDGTEQQLRDIGQLVARRRQMHVTVADLTYQKEVESMLRATSGRLATWFGPSPTEPEFTINHAFGHFGISVYYPTNFTEKRTLIAEFESELEKSGIAYITEFPEDLK